MHRVPMSSLAPVYRALSVGTAVPFVKCSGQGDDMLSGWMSLTLILTCPMRLPFPDQASVTHNPLLSGGCDLDLLMEPPSRANPKGPYRSLGTRGLSV